MTYRAILADPPDPSPVAHPPHYNVGTIEVIDVIEDWQLDFHLGNAVKYIARADHKGDPITDLEKAKWYIDRRLAQLADAPLAFPPAEMPEGAQLEIPRAALSTERASSYESRGDARPKPGEAACFFPEDSHETGAVSVARRQSKEHAAPESLTDRTRDVLCPIPSV